MRYLLDTNILAFLISAEYDSISSNVTAIIDDYNNQLFVSSVSVVELLQIYRIGKIKPKRYKTAQQILEAIEKDFFVKILPFAKPHTETLAKLKIATAHNDPFDHAIIAHAMAENLKLVSSDKKFKEYVTQKLLFCYNKR
jgi:PIN domain nuclease of toxin-antitoxin system